MEYETVNVTSELLGLLHLDKIKLHKKNINDVIVTFRNSHYNKNPQPQKMEEEEFKMSEDELRKHSIVPGIMNSKGIRFLGKSNNPISICWNSPYSYQDKFEKPNFKVLTELGKKACRQDNPKNVKTMDYE